MTTSFQPSWNLREAARFFGVSERNLWGLVTQGKVPGYRIGRQWRFSPDELSAWAAKASQANVAGTDSEQATN